MELDFLPRNRMAQALIVVVVLLTIYMAYVYLRMQRLKRALHVENAVPLALYGNVGGRCLQRRTKSPEGRKSRNPANG